MGYYLLLCLFGAGVGMLSGLLGIGGGVAMVPGLVILFSFSQTHAQGTSLAVLSLPVALFAALVYYQKGEVQLPQVGAVALGFFVGAYAGALLVMTDGVPLPVLRVAFGVALLYVGFLFVTQPTSARPAVALPAGIATLCAALLAWLLRRRVVVKPRPPDPPGEDVEYHL